MRVLTRASNILGDPAALQLEQSTKDQSRLQQVAICLSAVLAALVPRYQGCLQSSSLGLSHETACKGYCRKSLGGRVIWIHEKPQAACLPHGIVWKHDQSCKLDESGPAWERLWLQPCSLGSWPRLHFEQEANISAVRLGSSEYYDN